MLCVGVCVGGWVLDVPHAVRGPWLWAAVASGALMLAIDLYETAAFMLQVRGVVVLAKFLVLACLPLLGERAAWVLGVLVVLSVLSSHAPSAVRYKLVVGIEGVRGAETKG